MPLIPPAAVPTDIRDWTRWAQEAIEELVSDDLADGSITDAKLRSSAANSVIGRAGSTTGTPTDIAIATAGHFLVNRAGTLQGDAILDSDIPASISRDSEVTAAIGALNLDSGTYTPSLTNVSNLDASTTHSCQYLRVGATVTVSGYIEANPTAGASTQLGISLPIASNLINLGDCAGVAASPGASGVSAAIVADTANNRAEMQWVATDLNNQSMFFSFTYRVN